MCITFAKPCKSVVTLCQHTFSGTLSSKYLIWCGKNCCSHFWLNLSKFAKLQWIVYRFNINQRKSKHEFLKKKMQILFYQVSAILSNLHQVVLGDANMTFLNPDDIYLWLDLLVDPGFLVQLWVGANPILAKFPESILSNFSFFYLQI